VSAILSLMLALGGAKLDPSALAEANAAVQQVYDAVVADDGAIDYPALKRSAELQQALQRYVDLMAQTDPDAIEDRNLKIAVFSNAYNVFTLVGVTRAWPVKSVKNIRFAFGFFTRDEWVVGGDKKSLNDVEKKILRDLDPRIHFIINCASASCPKLLDEVLTAENVEALMDRATRDFLNDPAKNQFDRENDVWRLSKIFDWYQNDWGKKKDVIAFIQRYREDLRGWTPDKVEYLDYDWALNGPTGKE